MSDENGDEKMGKLPVPMSAHDRALAPAELLAQVPEEGVWLANFPSPRTRATYRNAVAEFVAFLGLSSPDQLYGLEQAHVIAWREELIKHGASARTIASRLSALSSLYKHLCEKQLCAENPVAGVKRPKVTAQTVETAALSAAQVRTMLDAPNTDTVQGLRDRALLHVFFYTGCRVSEPSVLKVKDFHQDQGYWVVDFTVKGGKRNRVAVSVECQLALADYLEAAGHGDERNGYLFRPVKNGRGPKPMDRSQLHQLFQKYARLAGVPEGVTPHSARATVITEALQHDHPAEAVQRTVGHASVTTTLAYDKRDHHPRKSASFAVRY